MYLVASIKFEPVTLARRDCIPTRAHGNEKSFLRLDWLEFNSMIGNSEGVEVLIGTPTPHLISHRRNCIMFYDSHFSTQSNGCALNMGCVMARYPVQLGDEQTKSPQPPL